MKGLRGDKEEVIELPRAYNEANVVCPFYKASATKSISCEGITDSCTIKLLFETTQEKDLYRQRFCDNNYKYRNCGICMLLEKKYE